MDMKIDFFKFGRENKQILTQIKKWEGNENIEMVISGYLKSTWRNKCAIAYLNKKEVVGFALVEQFFNEDEKQGQCNIDYVCVKPDALHSGIEEFIVDSVVENKNKILAKKAPTLFMARAGAEQKDLLDALCACGFGEFEKEGNDVLAFKNKNKLNERE